VKISAKKILVQNSKLEISEFYVRISNTEAIIMSKRKHRIKRSKKRKKAKIRKLHKRITTR
jgi:hypothetical protein